MTQWNDIPYDVLEALCKETAIFSNSGHNETSSRRRAPNDARKSLFALSVVDSRTREACYPWLFHKVTFDKKRRYSPSWEGFDERMKLMVKNPALCRAVKTFELDAWVGDVESNCPSPTTYALLPTFLASFPQLRTLNFRVQDAFVPGFQTAFDSVVETHGPFLTIENLTISRSCVFLIQHCPNILEFEEDSLYRDKDVQFVTMAESLRTCCQRLRHISTKESITSKTLRDLLTYIPHLEELKLEGGVRSWCNDPEDQETSGQGIMKFLPTFARFPNLRKLILPNASSLDIGFNPPWCGNAYMNNPGLVEQVAREGREASERVAKGVQTLCPVVSELWVGRICFRRDEKGIMVCPDTGQDC
ncbi:hypothetical protein JAAARDRAFT_197635 [Jaapia argillacea MUCL 33604]|uniref:F-box domain-containing protein n=1 Tax=Jaapia argillacea MUCL 33604 TaxID=933084 RepID=A0A067PPB9_9AGAM|nr:hypothetical protein JAAARDRAFT_197635 [Jaapia argillacea MUCL 33604]